MAIGYTTIQALAGQQTYLQQMSTALVKQAMSKIGAATGNELALCSAIIKTPTAYAGRFLLDALLIDAATLVSTNGSTLDSAPSDSAIDTTVTAQWASQVLAGA